MSLVIGTLFWHSDISLQGVLCGIHADALYTPCSVQLDLLMH